MGQSKKFSYKKRRQILKRSKSNSESKNSLILTRSMRSSMIGTNKTSYNHRLNNGYKRSTENWSISNLRTSAKTHKIEKWKRLKSRRSYECFNQCSDRWIINSICRRLRPNWSRMIKEICMRVSNKTRWRTSKNMTNKRANGCNIK